MNTLDARSIKSSSDLSPIRLDIPAAIERVSPLSARYAWSLSRSLGPLAMSTAPIVSSSTQRMRRNPMSRLMFSNDRRTTEAKGNTKTARKKYLGGQGGGRKRGGTGGGGG